MKLHVYVYLRPVTVKLLLARMDKAWGGQKWLAEQIGLSESHLSRMLGGELPVPSGKQVLIRNIFRGMSHKKGGRTTYDDIFQQVIKEMSGASA